MTGVLDLHAGVHLDEEKLIVLVEKLERSRAPVADLAARVGAALADPGQRAHRNPRSRRLLDDLLVTPLHRAVALEKIHGVLVRVGEHLDLDVTRRFEILFHVDGGIAERGSGFGARKAYRGKERGFGVHDTHSASATAAGSLDDHRILDRAGALDDLLGIRGQRTLGARNAGHAGLGHRHLGADLVAHEANRIRAGSNENETAFLDLFGEVRVFREKPVARMDGLGVGDFGSADNGGYVEVTLVRGRRADAHGLIGKAHIFRLRIGLRMHDHCLDPQLPARALDAQGDLAPVRDQNLVEQLAGYLACHEGVTSRALAARSGRVSVPGTARALADDDKGLTVFDRLAIFDEDRLDDACLVRFDLVHELHRLDNAQGVSGLNRIADFHEGSGAGSGGAIEGSNHRGLDRMTLGGPAPRQAGPTRTEVLR